MSFRSALLASAAILVAGSASAADLPARVAAPAPYIAAAPIFTWTGFYAGLNAGGAWNGSRGISTTGFVAPDPFIFGNNGGDDVGFTGGAQIGYNMQFGSFVAGVEADINYLDRNGGGRGAFPALIAGAGAGSDFAVGNGNSGNWFGTVRGRLGFAFDRALIYGTGGLAYGGRSGTGSVVQRDFVEGLPGVFAVTETNLLGTGGNDSNVGWALGAGMEYAFSNSMSFKLEYLHVDLGRNSRTFTALAGPGTVVGGETITVRSDNKFDVVRAGVNFRF